MTRADLLIWLVILRLIKEAQEGVVLMRLDLF